MKKVNFLIFFILCLILSSNSSLVQKNEIQMFIRIFEVPSWQNIKIDTNISGKTRTYIKGGDITINFPREPLIVKCDNNDFSIDAQIRIIRENFPPSILDNKDIEVNPISEELLILQPSRLESIRIEGKFSEKISNMYTILINPISIRENSFELNLILTIKEESEEKLILKENFVIDLKKLNVIGIPTYIGRGRRGNVFYLTFSFIFSTKKYN